MEGLLEERNPSFSVLVMHIFHGLKDLCVQMSIIDIKNRFETDSFHWCRKCQE